MLLPYPLKPCYITPPFLPVHHFTGYLNQVTNFEGPVKVESYNPLKLQNIQPLRSSETPVKTIILCRHILDKLSVFTYLLHGAESFLRS